MKTIETYLPVFPGFYGTIFESSSEEYEFDYINEQRQENGLEPFKNDEDFDWDYSQYCEDVCKGCVNAIERELTDIGLVKSITFQSIDSPREYNFRNDSINVAIGLTKANERAILAYLKANDSDFEAYVKENYTSCSGFISSYPNVVSEYMSDEPLEHSHRLGSILNFILRNEGYTEMSLYDGIVDFPTIQAKNYEELLTLVKENEDEKQDQ